MNFPTLTKKQDSRFYAVQQEDVTVKSEQEGGYVLTRPRHTRTPRKTFSTGYTDISNADKLTLESFFNTVGGHTEFVWQDPVELTNVTVRFGAPMEFKYSGVGGNHRWDIAKIELEEV